MNGTPFRLATIARAGTTSTPCVALVLGDRTVDLAAVHEAYRAARGGATLSATHSIFALLEDWDANFAVLQEMAAFIDKEGVPAGAAVAPANSRLHAPVLRPGKMFYAAQNFQEHVDEMIRAGMTPAGGPRFTGEKSTTVPYLFLKAPSTLCGAFDDIAIPRGMNKIDREAEQTHQGRARARACGRVHDHERRLLPRSADPAGSAGAALGLARRQEPRQLCPHGPLLGPARLRV